MEHAIAQPAIQASTPGADYLPLTERLLGRLPGSRLQKLTLWALIPALRAVLLVLRLELTGQNTFGWGLIVLAIPDALVFAYAVTHAIWGSRKIAREARAIEPQLAELTYAAPDQARRFFQGMGSTVGPLGLSLAVTLVFTVVVGLSAWWSVPVTLILNALIYLPLAVLVWTYLMLMAGLHRLGARHLALESYGGDKSLGLRPVGKLAFGSFWTFTANLVPILLLSSTDALSLVIGLGFFLVGIAAFFLSMWRLHAQMSRARQRQLARARDLYEQAYAPLLSTYTLETLKDRSSLLGAAEALERRAEAIQTWPFSDAVIARIVVIAFGVVSAIVTRLALKPLGL